MKCLQPSCCTFRAHVTTVTSQLIPWLGTRPETLGSRVCSLSTTLPYRTGYSVTAEFTMESNSFLDRGPTQPPIAIASASQDITTVPTIGSQNWSANHVQGTGNNITTNYTNLNYVILSSVPKGLVSSSSGCILSDAPTDHLQDDIRAKITAGQILASIMTE